MCLLTWSFSQQAYGCIVPCVCWRGASYPECSVCLLARIVHHVSCTLKWNMSQHVSFAKQPYKRDYIRVSADVERHIQIVPYAYWLGESYCAQYVHGWMSHVTHEWGIDESCHTCELNRTHTLKEITVLFCKRALFSFAKEPYWLGELYCAQYVHGTCLTIRISMYIRIVRHVSCTLGMGWLQSVGSIKS